MRKYTFNLKATARATFALTTPINVLSYSKRWITPTIEPVTLTDVVGGFTQSYDLFTDGNPNCQIDTYLITDRKVKIFDLDGVLQDTIIGIDTLLSISVSDASIDLSFPNQCEPQRIYTFIIKALSTDGSIISETDLIKVTSDAPKVSIPVVNP